jgi:hypothetical protein
MNSARSVLSPTKENQIPTTKGSPYKHEKTHLT